jgi:hypothetical protein
MTALIRTTVRLHEPEAEFVGSLKRRTPEAEAFTALTGEDASTLAAGTIVNALVEAGMQAVRQRAEEIRYAQLAQHIASDPESRAWRVSRRARAARRRESAGAGQ